MRGLETDHEISGPMRGLKKIASGRDNTQTYGHDDYQTKSSQNLLDSNLKGNVLMQNTTLAFSRGTFHGFQFRLAIQNVWSDQAEPD